MDKNLDQVRRSYDAAREAEARWLVQAMTCETCDRFLERDGPCYRCAVNAVKAAHRIDEAFLGVRSIGALLHELDAIRATVEKICGDWLSHDAAREPLYVAGREALLFLQEITLSATPIDGAEVQRRAGDIMGRFAKDMLDQIGRGT